MPELLDCPFCGGEAELNEWPDETAMIVCTACEARGPMFEDDDDNVALAIAARNRRAPSADHVPDAGKMVAPPVVKDCLTTQAAYRAGAEAMRERAAEAAEKAVWCPCGGPPCQTPAGHGCGVHPAEGVEVATAIRALPLPAGGSGWRDMTDKPTWPMPVLYWFGKRWWHQADGTPATLDPVRDPAERAEAGWWNGEEWCESGTGHDLFEPWREERDLPTAWQPLPAAPEEGG